MRELSRDTITRNRRTRSIEYESHPGPYVIRCSRKKTMCKVIPIGSFDNVSGIKYRGTGCYERCLF